LIKRIEKDFSDFPLSALTDRRTRGVFMAWRDKIAAASGRRQADYAWDVLARVLSWGLDRGLVLANPCTRGGRRYRGSRRGERMYGHLRTRPRSSSARQHGCIWHLCSRYGRDSAKATCCACRGMPTTASTFGCGNPRLARAL